MAIKAFVLTFLILAGIAYFIPVKNSQKVEVDKDMPLVVFEKPLMYTLDEKNIHRIIVANSAVKYKNRDEMFNADITLKNQDQTQNYNHEKLKADKIVKNDLIYTLTNNVKYTRDNFIKLNTQELIFDDKNKIAQNDKPFDGVYNANYVNGSNLYLDINNDFIKANNTHFEIDVTKK